MLNYSEKLALNAILEAAIIDSEDDDGDPVFHEVLAEDVNTFEDKRLQADVYDDLAQNGLIACSGTQDENGNEVLEFVCITPKGLEELKSSSGVH
ncbi:hypothetical protein [Methyloradius palustris]|uniref:Uncharacterized protein n=1 Tax=Methyloradius palustris TaxID=2778876 RepID=A0A8D5G213_9PROT|nr:hypothetical protein [Methyloradius palustris]BCM25940.1 hypothetical protein ZMTM_21990 [Methyloradius palustris]